MSEVFSILLHNRQRYEQGKEGLWFSLPTTTEKLQEALREIGISADNPQDFFLYDYRSPQERPIKFPRDLVLSADVDELNFLAARLEKLDAAELAELNAALTSPQSDFRSIGQIIDYPDNVDYYVHLPDVTGTGQLGDYYLNRSGMVDMPEEWKAGIFLPRFGLHIANTEHGVFTDYGYLACPLARREQLPLVLTEHSSLVNQETLPKDIEQAAKTAFTQADTLIAVSPALAHHMEQHSGRHVEWIPDMVDTELFAYSDRHERQKALEQETDLSEDSGGFSILSCGNLRRIKRMDVLIRAFAQAFRECPQVTLTICGQGEEEGMLRKLIFDLGMTGRIELTGLRPRREIAQRLQEADCFALASVSETFGVSYLEALSCGVPVIATRCGGPECFVNEHNGIMVEPDNVDDLAKAMQTMYYNISYYNRAEIARKIREDYSAQAVASRLMEQYERLARRAGSELVGSFSR